MRKVFIIYFFLLMSCICNHTEFDQSKWNEVFDGYYEYRELMVQDLITNHLQKGMSYKKVIDLLGEPNYNSLNKSNEIMYEIMVDYHWNIDPTEGKDLYIKFDKDSILINTRLKHWEH